MPAAAHDAVIAPVATSIDPAEVAKFAAMAEAWWDPRGKFRPLHKFNPVRLGFIRDTVCAHFGRDAAAKRPLEGLRLLDIGCGGGLLCEPMTRLGASVTGVDATEPNIKTAMTHAAGVGLSIDYRVGTAEGLVASGEELFDVVLNMEVVEHVADPAAFLRTCASLLKPGGIMIVATLNRTAKAFALAVVGAEHVLRWLPVGTHDWAKFVRPEEIKAALGGVDGLALKGPIGVSYNPLMDQWSLGSDSAVNYMMVVERDKASA
jgi:2-polyprenyl-6-hydroxyphenyl methylase/3-demethylubiquinone-9 3-methyltransferase